CLIRRHVHRFSQGAIRAEHVAIKLPASRGSLPDTEVFSAFDILPDANVSDRVRALLDSNITAHHGPRGRVAKTNVLVDVGFEESGNRRLAFDGRMPGWQDLGIVRVVRGSARSITLVEVARN